MTIYIGQFFQNRYIDRSKIDILVSIFEKNNAGFVPGTQKFIQNDMQHDYIGRFFQNR